MDSMIIANRNGNVACTQGGESLAGFKKAVEEGIVREDEIGVLDSTAHMLKFLGFQEMYFNDSFDPEFEIRAREELRNAPILVKPGSVEKYPGSESILNKEETRKYIGAMTVEIARILNLKKKNEEI